MDKALKGEEIAFEGLDPVIASEALGLDGNEIAIVPVFLSVVISHVVTAFAKQVQLAFIAVPV